MPLTAAEKQRRYRQRLNNDPVRRMAYLQKEKSRNRKKKIDGKVKPIAEQSKREQRQQRKRWRQYKVTERNKRKKEEDALAMTPPGSPLSDQHDQGSRQRQEALRRRNRNNAKCYRENEKLKTCLEKEKRKTEMYRRRFLRAENRVKSTPKKKTEKLLKSSPNKIRKTLNFHHTLIQEIKAKYKNGDNKMKRTVASLVAGKIMSKYKLQTRISAEVGCRGSTNSYKRKGLSFDVAKRVKSFYLRDDNSAVVTGLKQTVTFRKVKKQKRHLRESITILHRKFSTENKDMEISYSTFWRLKPFWVKHPQEWERKTCQCKVHENFGFVLEKLNNLKVLPTKHISEFLKSASCDVESKNCMHGLCGTCREFSLNLKDVDRNQEVTWKQWRQVKETRIIKGSEKKDVSFVSLKEESGTLSDLADIFIDMVPKIKTHCFNVTTQFNHYQYLRKFMSPTECVVHIDFAENYVGKRHVEIQSMHFGAAKKQITLHTGIIYLAASRSETFTTVSNSMEHGPAGIWSHLRPILKDIRLNHPDIETVHFFSDGPTAQYRQKGNFFLFSNIIFQEGFREGTWNFFASGHGKGAPDGVGGYLKRTADNLVRLGHDIMDASTLVNTIGPMTNVQLKVVEVDEKIKKKFERLPSVPGTMKLHQVHTNSPGQLHHRQVSCTCSSANPCEGHSFETFCFPVDANNTNKTSQSGVVPLSTSDAPPSTSDAPLSTSDAPPGTSDAPPSISDAPPSSSDAPPSSSDAPPGTSDAPPSTSDAPPSTSDVLPGTSDAPPGTSDAPPSTSDAPPSTSDAAPGTSDAPSSTSDAPPSTSDAAPSTSDAAPGTSDAPPGTSDAHASTSDAPPSTSNAPTMPTGTSVAPGDSDAAPGTSDVLPGTSDAPLGTSVTSSNPHGHDSNDTRKTLHDLKLSLTSPEDLVGSFVLVVYDNEVYPGKVIDSEVGDILVECMHHISRTPNCFFWPRMSDRCWYPFDTKVLCTIPEPSPISDIKSSRHKKVDEDIWGIIMSSMFTKE